MVKILWVEDQYHWIDKFKAILESSNFSFDDNQLSCKNQLEIHRFAESANLLIHKGVFVPDIVILDANMNGNDNAGLSLSKKIINKWPDVPIIYLSEHSGTEIEQKVFEENAATDFIAKHQRNIEQVLVWRIKARLRHQQVIESPNQRHSDCLESGNLTIDLKTWNVYWHGQRLMNPANPLRPLAPTPRKILRYLVEASPSPLSTEQMADKLDLDKFTYANYRQHIKTLRDSFDYASHQAVAERFSELCKQEKGIVTFGDQGAYQWRKC